MLDCSYKSCKKQLHFPTEIQNEIQNVKEIYNEGLHVPVYVLNMVIID